MFNLIVPPPGITESYPKVLASFSAVLDLVQFQLEQLFKELPSLYGVEFWSMESSPLHPFQLPLGDQVPYDERMRALISRCYETCERHNKYTAFDIHSGGGNTGNVEAIIRACATGEFPNLILRSDCTWTDWHLHLPTCVYLDRMTMCNRVLLGYDVMGEYWGRARVPTCFPKWINQHLQNSREKTVGGEGRIDWRYDPKVESGIGTLAEINTEALCWLLWNPNDDLDTIWKDFVTRKFGQNAEPRVTRALKRCQDILERVMFTTGCYFSNHSSMIPVEHYRHPFQGTRHYGKPYFWPFQSPGKVISGQDWPTPRGVVAQSLEEILWEKEHAIQLCRDSLSDIEKAKPHLLKADYNNLRSGFEGLLLVSRAHRILAEAMGLREVMLGALPGDRKGAKVRLSELSRKFTNLASEIEDTVGSDFFQEMDASSSLSIEVKKVGNVSR